MAHFVGAGGRRLGLQGATITVCADGGSPVQAVSLGSLWARLGVRGVFFVEPPLLVASPASYRLLIEMGHEVGSHSLRGATHDGTLPNWSKKSVRDDARMAARLHEQLLGQSVACFALPGENTTCREGEYTDAISAEFAFLRSARHGLNELNSFDPSNLASVSVLSVEREWWKTPGEGKWAILRGECADPAPLLDAAKAALEASCATLPLMEVVRSRAEQRRQDGPELR